MSKLPYLVAEINATLEVYLSGRTGQQYNRAAFILCDDCAELASKLFLLADDSNWSDKKSNGAFKNFWIVTNEVSTLFAAKRSADHTEAKRLIEEIQNRRTRRNDFFHSTHLLDLNFHARDCVEAIVDLLNYGRLLFPTEWDAAVAATGNMETCEAVLRIDREGYRDPSVVPRMDSIIKKQPRVGEKPATRGCEVAHYPEDVHLRLAIRNGGKGLRDKLKALI